MEPEAAEAIRIADKHLAGKSPERRSALAQDILRAIVQHAGQIANAVIIEGLAKASVEKRH